MSITFVATQNQAGEYKKPLVPKPERRKNPTPITDHYSSPISRYYRLLARDDVVPRDELPYEFVDSSKRINSQANRAFGPDGPATALFAELADPYLFTVYGDRLDIPQRYRHVRCIRSKTALKVWRKALRKAFKGAYLFKFEVALDDDELHVHIVADESAGLFELVRGSKACEPVTNPEGVVRYLKKPPCYPIKKRVREHVRARKLVGDAKLPEVSGYEGLPPKSERSCQSTTLETPSQTQKIGVGKSSYIYRALRPSRPAPLSPERFERWLSGSFGTFDKRVWGATGPPGQGKT